MVGLLPVTNHGRTAVISLNLPIDIDILQLLTKAFLTQSGTTAVTSIST